MNPRETRDWWRSRFGFSTPSAPHTPTVTPLYSSNEEGRFDFHRPRLSGDVIGKHRPSQTPKPSARDPGHVGEYYESLGIDAVPELSETATELTEDYATEFHQGTANAIARLEDFLTNINSTLDQRIADIQGVMPVDPYSEEHVQRNIEFAKDEASRTLQQNLGYTAASNAARGFEGGGQLSAAGALLRGEALRTGVEAGITERDKQITFNQAANQVRETFLSDITIRKTDMNKVVTGALADLEKTDVLNYDWLYRIAEGLESMDLSKQMHDELIVASQEAAESMEPDAWDAISNALMMYGQMKGMPWASFAGALAPAGSNLLEWLGE